MANAKAKLPCGKAFFFFFFFLNNGETEKYILTRDNLSVVMKHFCFGMKHSGFVAWQNLFKKFLNVFVFDSNWRVHGSKDQIPIFCLHPLKKGARKSVNKSQNLIPFSRRAAIPIKFYSESESKSEFAISKLVGIGNLILILIFFS